MPLPSQSLFIIPSYNPGKNRLLETVIMVTSSFPKASILVIDDGSTDGSCDGLPGVHILRNKQNLGKGGTLAKALLWAKEHSYKFAITLDADGQHLPSDLKDFKIHDFDICIGARSLKYPPMPFERVCSNRLTTWWVSKICKQNVYDSQSGFRIYKLSTIETIMPLEGRFEWESRILVRASWNNLKVTSFAASTVYHKDGPSHISHVKDTWRFIKMLWRLKYERLD